MCRLLAILLLVFVPLQLSWAAASEYCRHHEEGAGAAHFGHHDGGHAHPDTDSGDRGQSDSSTSAETPHGYHHHGGSPILVSDLVLPGHSSPRAPVECLECSHTTATPLDRIERPKWIRFA